MAIVRNKEILIGFAVGLAATLAGFYLDLEFVSPSVDDPPLIHLNYLSDPEDYDISTLVKGLRFGREVASTAPLSEFLGEELAPGPGVVSDRELAEYARDTCETVYHPSGTCRMGTDADAVVSPDLKVHGLQNMRVCDASVFPTMVTVNINNTVMMVAEKAAAEIIRDHSG